MGLVGLTQSKRVVVSGRTNSVRVLTVVSSTVSSVTRSEDQFNALVADLGVLDCD